MSACSNIAGRRQSFGMPGNFLSSGVMKEGDGAAAREVLSSYVVERAQRHDVIVHVSLYSGR